MSLVVVSRNTETAQFNMDKKNMKASTVIMATLLLIYKREGDITVSSIHSHHHFRTNEDKTKGEK